MRRKSTNLQPPYLGPGKPLYPELRQIVRVPGSSSSASGTPAGLFSAFLAQAAGGEPSLRDREAVWLWEPNGISLSPGYYKSRLLGNYQGLPLLATSALCCQPSSFSSSSVSESSVSESSISESSESAPSVPSSAVSSPSPSSSSSSSESSGPCCDCRYQVRAFLMWSDNSDLDVYLRNVTEGVTCFFGAPSVGGLTLNHDAHPLCDPSPLPPEIIQGNFHVSQKFSGWYNQYSQCSSEVTPTVFDISVLNLGVCPITVNGETVYPGDELILDLAYGGYAAGEQPNFAHGTMVEVVCPCESSLSSSSSSASPESSSSSSPALCNYDCPECPDGLVNSFSFHAEGFTAGFIILNGDWTLTYQGQCSFSYSDQSVKWTLAPDNTGDWRLTGECFAGVVQYIAFPTELNGPFLTGFPFFCKCLPSQFLQVGCGNCPQGTPLSYTVTLTGFGGGPGACFNDYEGLTITLNNVGGCQYFGTAGEVLATLDLAPSSALDPTAKLFLESSHGGIDYSAFPAYPPGPDCNSPITFLLPNVEFCDVGPPVYPSSITVTPSADTVAVNGPTTLTLIPAPDCPCPSVSSESSSSSSLSEMSSSSSEEFGILTPCCDNAIAGTLRLTFTYGSEGEFGSCTGCPDGTTVDLHFTNDPDPIFGDIGPNYQGGCGQVWFVLFCVTEADVSNIRLNVECLADMALMSGDFAVSFTCDPFSADFAGFGAGDTACCDTTGTSFATITITE